VLSPLVLSLMALYITGLLLLDRRQNGIRVLGWLPAWAHDAINCLLRTLSISTRALMRAIKQLAKHLGSGYLAIDDVVVAKSFCWLNPWIGRTFCTSERRKVRGSHVVVLLWSTGSWCIPAAFCLWRPKKNCHPKRHRKNAESVLEMVIEVLSDVLEIEYVVGDTFYTASWLTYKINRLGLKHVGVLHHQAIVFYQERRWSVALGRVANAEMACSSRAPSPQHCGHSAQVRHLEIGRDQKPSRECGGTRHQRLGQRSDLDCVAQAEPLVD
jgi:hypothetical protein